MSNNKKIINRLINTLIEENIHSSINEDEIQLIINYLDDNLSLEQKNKFEKRLINDDDFKFLFDITKFEAKRKKPKNFLLYYVLRIKHYFRLTKTRVNQSHIGSGKHIALPIPILSSSKLVSYKFPIIAVSASLLFITQLQPYSYSFNQTGYNNNLFLSTKTVRGDEEEKIASKDSLEIIFSKDSLKISWHENNPNIAMNCIELNNVSYFTKNKFIEIPIMMKKKPLRRLIDYINRTKKLNDNLNPLSDGDSLEIKIISFSSIKALPLNNKIKTSLVDYNKIGLAVNEKTFKYLISK